MRSHRAGARRLLLRHAILRRRITSAHRHVKKTCLQLAGSKNIDFGPSPSLYTLRQCLRRTLGMSYTAAGSNRGHPTRWKVQSFSYVLSFDAMIAAADAVPFIKSVRADPPSAR